MRHQVMAKYTIHHTPCTKTTWILEKLVHANKGLMNEKRRMHPPVKEEREPTSLSFLKAGAKLLHFFELYKFISLKMILLSVF